MGKGTISGQRICLSRFWGKQNWEGAARLKLSPAVTHYSPSSRTFKYRRSVVGDNTCLLRRASLGLLHCTAHAIGLGG
jgi:hypothetical protein